MAVSFTTYEEVAKTYGQILIIILKIIYVRNVIHNLLYGFDSF